MGRIEELIGETILQDAKTVKVKGVGTIQVASPSVATLIEASKVIGRLPDIPSLRDSEERGLAFTLAYARDCAILGEIAAVLMLGKKFINRKAEIASRAKSWKNNWPFKYFVRRPLLREVLAEALLEEYDAGQLQEIIVECLGLQKIAFFLSTITSLSDANLLRKTRSGTTASGL